MKTYTDGYDLSYFNALKTYAARLGFDASYEGEGEITLHYENNGTPAAIGFAGSYSRKLRDANSFIKDYIYRAYRYRFIQLSEVTPCQS